MNKQWENSAMFVINYNICLRMLLCIPGNILYSYVTLFCKMSGIIKNLTNSKVPSSLDPAHIAMPSLHHPDFYSYLAQLDHFGS